MSRVRYKKGDIVVGQGTTRDNYFFIDSGIISVERYRKPIIRAGRGSFIAKIYATPRRGVHRFSMIAEEESVLYTLDVMEFYRFLEKNPGVFLTLREARIRDTIQTA